MKENDKVIKIIVPLLVFFLGCGVMYGVIYRFPTLLTTSVTQINKDVTITDTGIAEAVEKVYDSVVVVSTYSNNQVISTGTGFVFKNEGDKAYILTNNHVIADGDKVNVTLTNNSIVETEVVGADILSDIAVLSLNKKDIISVADLGSSESLRVGDTTFAVGAPLDSVYSWTVTRGIVSGKDRMVEVELSSTAGDYVMKVLQTDAAINSGNSGGPLCNANGEVIGITSLKLVDESVEGMGFAIPIETALSYAEKLISGETLSQPYIGVSMLNVRDFYSSNQHQMQYYQFYKIIHENEIASGVIIADVEKNSPADKAGLKTGDVITKINDDDVISVAFLRYYLYGYSIGEEVTISYIRDGKTKTTKVVLGKNSTSY